MHWNPKSSLSLPLQMHEIMENLEKLVEWFKEGQLYRPMLMVVGHLGELHMISIPHPMCHPTSMWVI